MPSRVLPVYASCVCWRHAGAVCMHGVWVARLRCNSWRRWRIDGRTCVGDGSACWRCRRRSRTVVRLWLHRLFCSASQGSRGLSVSPSCSRLCQSAPHCVRCSARLRMSGSCMCVVGGLGHIRMVMCASTRPLLELAYAHGRDNQERFLESRCSVLHVRHLKRVFAHRCTEATRISPACRYFPSQIRWQCCVLGVALLPSI